MNERSQRNRAIGVGAFVALLSVYLSYGVAQPLDRFAWRVQAAWTPLTWFTCHFVHLSGVHLVVNLIALVMLLWIAQRLSVVGGFVAALGISACAVSLGLAMQWWPVAWYCGLSGALHGGFAWLTIKFSMRFAYGARWMALALWTGGLFKVLAETFAIIHTPDLFGFPVVPQAHLFGYVGASLWALVSVGVSYGKSTRPTQKDLAG